MSTVFKPVERSCGLNIMLASGVFGFGNAGRFSKLIDFHSANINGSCHMDHFSNESNLSEALSVMRTCHLVTMLENCLYKAKHNKLQCSKVLVPKELTTRVAQKALALSLTEPCGLRGCIIHVNLESGNKQVQLDTLVYDSMVEPTFELTLVLKQDNQTWDHLRDLITRTCFPILFKGVLKLSPKYLLFKRKLYFSIVDTGIEDC